MFVVLIPIIGIIGMFVYTWYQRKQLAVYFKDKDGQKEEEDRRLLKLVLSIIHRTEEAIQDKIVVNGHFITQTVLVRKTTTYYSYVILYDSILEEAELISYNPDSKESSSLGVFRKDAIEAIDLGGQTNYLFHEATTEKLLYSVQTIAHDVSRQGEYEIRYSQVKAYNDLRQHWKLPPISEKLTIGGKN